ncbi:hypothetical protein [Pseudochrobactrum sp. MP213Fo]|uniref:hypothetical protein n=1 Tax=Pseudochrobactrum sp. MP213Fo TaxID=3022250 RepID=UPI003BA0437D
MPDNFDKFLPDWTVGTLTLVAGAKTFTAANAQLTLAPIRKGDTIITPSGLTLIIESINADGNGGVLYQNTPAPAAGTFQTLIRFQSDNSRFTGQLAALVQLMSGGNLQSLAGLSSNKDLLPYFNGAGTMAATQFTELARTVISRANGAQVYSDLGTIPVAQVPDMAPQKAFRRGNILGNVSQSGGVPTGAVIQSGSNANGDFVRYADGTQIFSASGVVAEYSSGDVLRAEFSYSANFILPPALMALMNSAYDYNGTAFNSSTLMASGGSSVVKRFTRNNSATIDIMRPAAGAWSSGDAMKIDCVAIGRWF